MQKVCSAIVRTFGSAWTTLGWMLFVVALVIPIIPFFGAILAPVWLGVRIALGLWWVIDMVEQDFITTYVGGTLLLVFVAFVFRPHSALFIICWLVYMTSVRKKS